jgi:hypothetical protein
MTTIKTKSSESMYSCGSSVSLAIKAAVVGIVDARAGLRKRRLSTVVKVFELADCSTA